MADTTTVKNLEKAMETSSAMLAKASTVDEANQWQVLFNQQKAAHDDLARD